MNIRQSYDKIADAIYLQFRDSKIHKTKEFDSGILVDYDKQGFVVGVEVLDAVRRKFKFSIMVPKKSSHSAEISAGKSRVNLPIPYYL